jgi:hypothetical protein
VLPEFFVIAWTALVALISTLPETDRNLNGDFYAIYDFNAIYEIYDFYGMAVSTIV